jgi:polyketide synthase PksN
MTARRADLDVLQSRLEPFFDRCFSDDLEQVYQNVDRLCLNLCLHVARDCRLLGPTSEPLDQIIERVGVVPPAIYLLRAVLDILSEEGFARRTWRGWAGRRLWPPDVSAELQRSARVACPEATPVFQLIERCRQHATSFLTGQVTGLEVIFPRGDIEPWERLHTEDRVMSIYADLVPPALEAIAVRRMRILEVGSGVGAVLRRCALSLQQFDVKEYWFTDLGRSFVQRAQRNYADVSWLRFADIDIDKPLQSQDLPADSFDVVIGVNVLHAAKRLRASLREIHNVLKPNGYLILAEGSPPNDLRRWRLDVVFAFLRGWWDIVLEPIRPRAGFLTPSEWGRALRTCNFDPIYILPGEQWFSGPCRGGVLVAGKQVSAGRSWRHTGASEAT